MKPIWNSIARSLAPGRVEAAAALASVPALIRGYGHVKHASAEKAAGERSRLLERLADAPALAGPAGRRMNRNGLFT